jgi:Enoyl-CoA hydratase/isomerase
VILQSEDHNRVRTLTLNRPEALNAFNEALYKATAEALSAAADDPGVAVVLLTGAGRAFSAGNDLKEMQSRITDPQTARQGSHFTTMIDALSRFPKPLRRERRRRWDRHDHPRLCGPGVHVFDGSTEMPVHQLRCRTGSGVVVSAATVGRQAERCLAVDVLGVGKRRRGPADGPGLEGM